MPDDIRARLECADELDQDERLKTSAQTMLPVYACDLLASPHEAACRLSPRLSDVERGTSLQLAAAESPPLIRQGGDEPLR
jgi:hypothetical protein